VTKAYGTSLQQDYATYTYSQNGKQTSVADANGNLAMMTYDGFDREVQWTFPSPTTHGAVNAADFEAYGYDTNGNRTSLRRRDGTAINYTYDALNRGTEKDVPTSVTGAAAYSVFSGYDNRGLELYARFASAGGSGVTNIYDNVGRLASSTSTMGGVSRMLTHQYDADGNRIQINHPDGGFFTYEYDGLDRLVVLREVGNAVLTTFSYDAAERRAGMTFSGASSNYGYDGISRLTSLSHDLVGTSADQSLGFGYSPASQIVSRTSSNDAYASNTALNVSRAYAVNGLNQYTAAGPASFTYDANGNLKTDGSNSYVYDGENRLVSSSGVNNVSLAYDPNGRLFQTSGGSAGATQLLYDGDALIGEYDTSGTMNRRYIHGDGADVPLIWYEYPAAGYRRGLFTDHQGSVIAVSDISGNPVAINAYDAWGIPNAGNQDRFGYTGQAWIPELGMWYYKARIYSPTLGRFLQTDPIGYKDQVNLYAYVGNDPVDGRDPSGEQQYESHTGSRINVAPPPRPPKSVNLGAPKAIAAGGRLIGAVNSAHDAFIDAAKHSGVARGALAPLRAIRGVGTVAGGAMDYKEYRERGYSRGASTGGALGRTVAKLGVSGTIGAGIGSLMEPGGGTLLGGLIGVGVGDLVDDVAGVSAKFGDAVANIYTNMENGEYKQRASTGSENLRRYVLGPGAYSKLNPAQ
jgi:RHS repeat-associated protein